MCRLYFCDYEVFENLNLGRKTAMKFDLEKMFEETRRTAREYSEQITGVCSLLKPRNQT